MQNLLTQNCKCFHSQCFKWISEPSQIHIDSAITITRARAMVHNTEVPSKPDFLSPNKESFHGLPWWHSSVCPFIGLTAARKVKSLLLRIVSENSSEGLGCSHSHILIGFLHHLQTKWCLSIVSDPHFRIHNQRTHLLPGWFILRSY